jgi:hypothetical protein
MTRQHAKELLPIITAFANGEDVQGFEGVSNEWVTLHDPSFIDIPKAYRIAPKPRKVWVNEYKSGNLYAHTSKEDADDCALGGGNELIACHEIELPPIP